MLILHDVVEEVLAVVWARRVGRFEGLGGAFAALATGERWIGRAWESQGGIAHGDSLRSASILPTCCSKGTGVHWSRQ